MLKHFNFSLTLSFSLSDIAVGLCSAGTKMLLQFISVYSCFLTFDMFLNIPFKVFLKGLVAFETLLSHDTHKKRYKRWSATLSILICTFIELTV